MTASWKNKLVGALATGAIICGLFPMAALGAGALQLDSEDNNEVDPAFVGYDLTVSGLENGDTASYYKIIELDKDVVDGDGSYIHVGNNSWKLTAAVDSDGDGIVDGTENTDFGHKLPGTDGKIGTSDDEAVNGLYVGEMVIGSFEEEDDEVTSDTRQLTPAMVNALSSAVTNNKAESLGELTATDGAVTVSDASEGLYMFVAVPKASDGETDYLYKPIFVSADYYNTLSVPEDGTHAIVVTEGETDYPKESGKTMDAGVFKRSPLSIDKQAGQKNADGVYVDFQNDVAIGDTIDFSITFPVPTYSKNYIAPQFYITDVLTEGIKLDPDSIEVVVKNGDTTIACAEETDYVVYTKAGETTDTGFNSFKNVATGTQDGFVVQFLNDNPDTDEKLDGFLYTVLGAPTATITYKGTVTTTEAQKFAQQVNQMDNTAKLNYSKDPSYVPDNYFVPNVDENGNPIQKTDENGDPVFIDVPVYDADGNPVYEEVPVLDDDDNPVMEEVPVVDENGNPVYVKVPVLDDNDEPVTETVPVYNEDGSPKYDEDGNLVTEEVPVYTIELQTELQPKTELKPKTEPQPLYEPSQIPDPDFDTNTPDRELTYNGEEEPTGTLTDKTRHYTFDIDGDILGPDQSTTPELDEEGNPIPGSVADESEHNKTSEIRKICIDSNGNVIQKKNAELVKKGGDEENGVSGEETGNYAWLEGAEFTLTKTQAHTAVEAGTGIFTKLPTPEKMKFDENGIRVTTGGTNPVSDEKGYIAMKGLDAGVYVLKEIKAPFGYAFNPNVQYEITITPTYVWEDVTPTEGTTPEDGKGGADDLILESYEVKIVCQELDDNLNIVGEETVTTISTYNMKKDENGKPVSLLTEDGSSNVAGENATGGIDVTVESFSNNESAMVVNKKLGILPATGGSGILFYLGVGGAIAAIALVLMDKTKKAAHRAA